MKKIFLSLLLTCFFVQPASADSWLQINCVQLEEGEGALCPDFLESEILDSYDLSEDGHLYLVSESVLLSYFRYGLPVRLVFKINGKIDRRSSRMFVKFAAKLFDIRILDDWYACDLLDKHGFIRDAQCYRDRAFLRARKALRERFGNPVEEND